MKVSELETAITVAGLFYKRTKDAYAELLQVWMPFDEKKGFKLDDGLWYNESVLPKEEIDKLNSKYISIIDLLKKNNIKIVRSSPVTNGLVAELIIHLKNYTLDNKLDRIALPNDYEIQTDDKIKTSISILKYENVLPKVTGFGYKFPDFRDSTLKKHEIAMVVKNTPDIIKMYSEEKNISWILGFVYNQNNIQPLMEAISSGAISAKAFLEEILPASPVTDKITSDHYKKLFTFLATQSIDEIDVGNRIYYRHQEVIVNNPSIFNKVVENWKFSAETGREFLKNIILSTDIKAFKKFITKYDANKYFMNHWKTLEEPVLQKFCVVEPKLLPVLVNNGWLLFNTIFTSDIVFFISEQINDYSEVVPLTISLYLKHSNDHNGFMHFMLQKFAIKTDESFLKDVFKTIMENINIDSITVTNCMVGNGIIMKYLRDYENNHPLKEKLLSSEEFVNYLLEGGQEEYLPDDVRDLFIFKLD